MNINDFGRNYGIATIADSEEEKIHGLRLLMKNQTGCHFTFDRNMAESVVVIKIVSDCFTAKARQIQK